MKKIFLLLGAAVMAAMVTYNVSVSKNSIAVLGMDLAKTEVLAQGEGGYDGKGGCKSEVETYIYYGIMDVWSDCVNGMGTFLG